jgi:hypothetical protein
MLDIRKLLLLPPSQVKAAVKGFLPLVHTLMSDDKEAAQIMARVASAAEAIVEFYQNPTTMSGGGPNATSPE